MTDFFTTDLHLGHKSISEYCGRPFKSLQEMDETLILNWNRRVNPEDTVYLLGDFGFGSLEKLVWYLNNLKGHKILIRGNHDRSTLACRKIGFEEVYNSLVIHTTQGRIMLRHSPSSLTPKGGSTGHMFPRGNCPTCLNFMKDGVCEHPVCAHCDYIFHGHVHEKWARRGKFINVGVDAQNFEPKTLAEILATPVWGASEVLPCDSCQRVASTSLERVGPLVVRTCEDCANAPLNLKIQDLLRQSQENQK